MKRIEVFLTQAIEEDFIDYFEKACKEENEKCKFTKIENIMGQGNTSPKMGDPVWPQLNVMIIIYCNEKIAKRVAGIMDVLHKQSVGEGAAASLRSGEDLK